MFFFVRASWRVLLYATTQAGRSIAAEASEVPGVYTDACAGLPQNSPVQDFQRIPACLFLAAAADGGALPSVRTTEPQVCSTRPNRLGDIISNDREPSCDLYHHYMCTCFHGISRGRNPSRYKRYYRHCLHFLLLALIRRCKNLGSI